MFLGSENLLTLCQIPAPRTQFYLMNNEGRHLFVKLYRSFTTKIIKITYFAYMLSGLKLGSKKPYLWMSIRTRAFDIFISCWQKRPDTFLHDRYFMKYMKFKSKNNFPILTSFCEKFYYRPLLIGKWPIQIFSVAVLPIQLFELDTKILTKYGFQFLCSLVNNRTDK